MKIVQQTKQKTFADVAVFEKFHFNGKEWVKLPRDANNFSSWFNAVKTNDDEYKYGMILNSQVVDTDTKTPVVKKLGELNVGDLFVFKNDINDVCVVLDKSDCGTDTVYSHLNINTGRVYCYNGAIVYPCSLVDE